MELNRSMKLTGLLLLICLHVIEQTIRVYATWHTSCLIAKVKLPATMQDKQDDNFQGFLYRDYCISILSYKLASKSI